MDELQAGIQLPLAVLPQPSALFQPCEAALNNPSFGHHLERMQLASLGNLYRHIPAQNLPHSLREGLAHVAAVAQQALHPLEPTLAAR